MKLRIKKIDKDAIIPSYAYDDDAGFDLYTSKEVEIGIGERFMIPTGLALEIPKGYVGLVWDKSGLSINHGLKTLGGVIDSGYRGEVQVGVINLGDKLYTFHVGDKVAQMIIQKKETVEVEEVETLNDSEREGKGFGSSGK